MKLSDLKQRYNELFEKLERLEKKTSQLELVELSRQRAMIAIQNEMRQIKKQIADFKE